jgi:hypothetical protein
VIAILSITAGVAQQPAPVNFYRVDFMKPKPGKTTEYEAFLKKNLPGISQASIKDGKLLSWGYTRVVTPTGTAQDHDLIGFYSFEKWEQMEPFEKTPDSVLAAMKALGFASQEDYAAKRDVLRDIVRSEIWTKRAGTTMTADNAPKAGEYVVIGYLKTEPGKTADYIDAWKKYSLPLQEERIKEGHLKSYSLWSVGGAGSGTNYDVVALSRFASFSDVNSGNDASAASTAVADRIHAGKDWRQMRRDMQSLRTPYRSEVVKIQLRTQ